MNRDKAGAASNLLQTFDQVEVPEGSMETVNVGFSVGGHLDWADGGDAGWVERDDFFSDDFLSCGQV